MKKLLMAVSKMGMTLALLCFSFANAHGAIVNINSITRNESNPVILSLAAGTYDVTPIGISDGGAYNSWNAWNWGQVYGCDGNGANCSVGWINIYYINSPDFPEMRLADDIRYANSLLALANALDTSFTLTSDAEVSFFIRDGVNGSMAWDNVGGISLDVTTVPIPGAAWLLGSAILALWRFKRSSI